MINTELSGNKMKQNNTKRRKTKNEAADHMEKKKPSKAEKAYTEGNNTKHHDSEGDKRKRNKNTEAYETKAD